MISITLNLISDTRYVSEEEFAERMGMKRRTVKHHISLGKIPIRPKTGVRETRYIDLVAFAMQEQIKPYLDSLAARLAHQTQGQYVETFFQIKVMEQGEENENPSHQNSH